MAAHVLHSEERIGLGVALAAHAGLVALLLWQPPAAPVVTPPDRIEVTISDDVALVSTSPEPRAEPAPDVAPEIGEPQPAPPEPVKAEPPKTEPKKAEPVRPPTAKVEPPRPEPRATPKPVPRAVPKPAPKPVAAPRPAPRPTASPRPAARPAPPRAAQPTRPATTRPATRPAAPAGTSRIGDDFLKGVQGARTTGRSANPPAQAAGPQVQASLLGAVSRALRPHWQGKVPEGADSEKLVTILRWSLNRDGTLTGAPQVVRQEGITDANRAQAGRHAEQAIRAVQLAAPFDLPEEYFDTWKRVTIKFDKRLSQ